MENKKAQLQMMENIVVLLILFMILAVSFIFMLNYQKIQDEKKLRELNELELIKKSRILNSFAEMQCSEAGTINPNCYDIIKMEAFKDHITANREYYKQILGNTRIVVKRYEMSPDYRGWKDEWQLFNNPKPEDNGVREIQIPVLLKDTIKGSLYFGVIFLGVYE